MPIDVQTLRNAVAAIAGKLEVEHAGLTELDGKMGDGDLGLTLLKAFRAMQEVSPALPADLGQALFQLGSATTKVSSSSFGTLLATAMLAVAKTLKGRQTAEWTELSGLLTIAREAMQARGKAELGDKTVLDALQASETSISGLDDPAAQLAAARQAVRVSLEEFKQRPNRIGRARVYGDKSIGLDDPGMVAFSVMLSAL